MMFNYKFDYFYYTQYNSFAAVSAYASGSIGVYAALSLVLLCSDCRPIWLMLLIFQVLIMTIAICSIVVSLEDDVRLICNC